ncbi:MAG: hypothetical protein Q8R55_04845 [Candidatus Taylorbacteria bacterium]|nr:hypothetical protein [Candidatus Taylorbacteria bacterium]
MESKDLTGKEIVRKWIIGSPANDRMTQEIVSVVNTLVGLLEQRERWFSSQGQQKPWENQSVWGFWDPRCDWQVTRVSIVSIKKGEFSWRISPTIPFSGETTQAIHESLPGLIEGIRQEWPSLEKHWQFLLDNADYAEKLGWKF